MDNFEDGTFGVALDPRFPVDDVAALGRMVENTGRLVAGFVPGCNGILDILAHRYATDIDGLETHILADRNVVTLLAQVAELGGLAGLTEEHLWAVRLMAVCQALEIIIDPSISYHEAGHLQGNEIALNELQWFRVADKGGDALAWIDLAVGRTTKIDLRPPPPREDYDLSFPLHRWNRNYAAALKIADLELENLAPMERMNALLHWMLNDFLLAGPAALFAAVFFAPRRPGKLLQRLRSDDREAAIGKIRNAAWDITYISDFQSKVSSGMDRRKQFIFATHDANLATITGLTLLGPIVEDGLPSLGDALSQWWGDVDGHQVAEQIFDAVDAARVRPAPIDQPGSPGVTTLIAAGEASIRNNWPRR